MDFELTTILTGTHHSTILFTSHSITKMPLPMATSEKPYDSTSLSSVSPESSNNTSSAVSKAAASVTDAGASSGSSAAQHTKSEAEQAADKLYEERMEDEYAKREGGA